MAPSRLPISTRDFTPGRQGLQPARRGLCQTGPACLIVFVSHHGRHLDDQERRGHHGLTQAASAAIVAINIGTSGRHAVEANKAAIASNRSIATIRPQSRRSRPPSRPAAPPHEGNHDCS